jgi:hypothetical protein
MFNDENLVREPREVEGYFEARNNRETGILVGQYLKATPIEQRREAQEDRPEYENKERAEEITKRQNQRKLATQSQGSTVRPFMAL